MSINKDYEIGDIVTITADTSCHGIEIGTEVVIISLDHCCVGVKSEGIEVWAVFDEIEHVIKSRLRSFRKMTDREDRFREDENGQMVAELIDTKKIATQKLILQ